MIFPHFQNPVKDCLVSRLHLYLNTEFDDEVVFSWYIPVQFSSVQLLRYI